MKKKILALCLSIAMLLTLAACGHATAEVNIRADGSGTITETIGLLKSTCEDIFAMYQEEAGGGEDDLGSALKQYIAAQEGADVSDMEFREVVEQGQTYVVTDITQTFSADGLPQLLNGAGHIIPGDNAFLVHLYHDDVNKPVFGLLEDDDGNSLYTSEELKYIKDTAIVRYSFQFPYPVSQVSGTADGITSDGNKLLIDFNALSDANVDYLFYVGDAEEAERIFLTQSAHRHNFADVYGVEWYAEATGWAKTKGIVWHDENDNLFPNYAVSNTMLAETIYAMREGGFPEANSENAWHWGEAATDFCVSSGILDGFAASENGRWGHSSSREKTVYAIVEYLKRTETGLPEPANAQDIPDLDSVAERYRENVRIAYTIGLVSGVNGLGAFAPDREVTRAELCQMLFNIRTLL